MGLLLPGDAMHAANKVARVTPSFWIMKICATTAGETAGDLLSMTLGVGYAASSALLIGCFGVALIAQLRSKTFHPAWYWTVILATSTAGTTLSDFLDRTLGLGYATGSLILLLVLVSILVVWRLRVGSLSVAHVSDPEAELFYWTAILVSNTLGTAVGDYLSDSSGLGYLASNLLISGVIAVIGLAYFLTAASRTALFWPAFVLTRPFGATMGDLLTKTPDQGGLGFGTIGSSAVLISILVIFIGISARHERGRRTRREVVD